MRAKSQTCGIFVDCRNHWTAIFEENDHAISFDKYRGGIVKIGKDGDDLYNGLKTSTFKIACRIRLICIQEKLSDDHGESVLIRQENDRGPKFHFLEEGPIRVGMRVAFDLIDDEGHYHGDGRQDIWFYPNGDTYCNFNLQIADISGYQTLQDAYVETITDKEANFDTVTIGPERLQGFGSLRRPIEKNSRSQTILFQGQEENVGIFWATESPSCNKPVSDHGGIPPFYASHWPTGMQQWARGGMGWDCHGDSAGIDASISCEETRVRLSWLSDANMTEKDISKCTFTGNFVMVKAENSRKLNSRIEAFQQPVEPTAIGGYFRGFAEENGQYEIGQVDPTQTQIKFPPDHLERLVRIRLYRRKTDPRHRGGILITVNGKNKPFQLVSEGELTDDICVPMEMSHRNDSVDDVLLTTSLDSNQETCIEIKKIPGLQAVYQSEITGLDLKRRAGNKRDLVIWTSHNHDKPLLELDLFSCAIHRLTNYGSNDPVLWEMPLAFFASCGISKNQYCNDLRSWSIQENGPDNLSLYFNSVNTNRGAQSETWLRIPYDWPRPRLEVTMKFTTLKQWNDLNVEFSDIFPYPSRLPETWFHDAVLFVEPNGSFIKYNHRPDLSGGTSTGSPDKLFYALYGSDRGNILTLIENPLPNQPMHYSVCGNYIDVHVNFQIEQIPVPANTTFEVNYISEVFGDDKTSVDELKMIGQNSVASGKLLIN
ncbi:MAG: hypothetical protein VX294_08285 [Candidatus Latescibacterota bacterium]|nr:hypothetical protein [Candidatus Latescibacterota bacterium]